MTLQGYDSPDRYNKQTLQGFDSTDRYINRLYRALIAQTDIINDFTGIYSPDRYNKQTLEG